MGSVARFGNVQANSDLQVLKLIPWSELCSMEYHNNSLQEIIALYEMDKHGRLHKLMYTLWMNPAFFR